MADVTVRCAGILFDMDGVLVSSLGGVRRCWRKWAAHYRLPNADSFEIEHGVRAVDIIRKAAPGIDVAEGLRLIEDMEIEDVSDLKVLPGVRALLASLPAERWCIVTSATHRLLVGRLTAAELPVPARIISAESVERGKPDPEPYRRGAELVGYAAGACIVVEDAPSGVQAGKAAGCRVLGVLTSHTAEQLRTAGADWVVASLEDVTASRTAEGGLELQFSRLQVGAVSA